MGADLRTGELKPAPSGPPAFPAARIGRWTASLGAGNSSLRILPALLSFATLFPIGTVFFAKDGAMKALRVYVPALCAVLLLGGCDKFGGNDDSDMDDVELSQFAFEGDSNSGEDDGNAVDASGENAQPLAFRVQVGDRFPLLRTVERSLIQESPEGVVTGKSVLELLMAITVEDVSQDGKQLRVQYDRVRYRQEVDGRVLVDYDSDSARGAVPAAAALYDRMVGDGFSFRLGPDNEITELVDFDAFLERCANSAATPSRRINLDDLRQTPAAEGIASFIDDTLVLLPRPSEWTSNGAEGEVGASWVRARQVSQPVAIRLNDRCTVKQLTNRYVVVDVVGTIEPGGSGSSVAGDIRLRPRGGHTFGKVTFDRETGLPVDARIERYIDLAVQTADGRNLEQRKRIVTQVRAFPQQGEPTTVGDHSARSTGVRAASAEMPAGSGTRLHTGHNAAGFSR